MHRSAVLSSAALLILLSCSSPTGNTSPNANTLFTKLPSSETGITFVNKNTEDAAANILTYEYFYNGGGVAIGDINNDGLSDIFFTANQEKNKLYLNKGDFHFEDISEKAGVGNSNGWRTGVAMADVNGDGYLDIYVCRSGWEHPLMRVNSLYINNKNLTFTDRAKDYGLNDDSFSTQASFFDYDRDGDLDMFLLNHSRLAISNSFDISRRYGNQRVRYVGNKLYRNDHGKFTDISDSVGIFGPASNYGLGIATADINHDGWMDIYTSNDYTEKDKLFYNRKGKRFDEVSDSAFSHISQFSMGIDIADINNDGWEDIISLDMLPGDNKRQKEFHWPEKYDVYASMYNNGLHHQYMRNMLQLNNGDGSFSEIGQLAGISNTDWSWAALFADFDNDGLQDLFVSNGFKRNFTDNDFLRYGVDLALKAKQRKGNEGLESILEKIPPNKVHGYMFRNKDGVSFDDMSRAWGFTSETLANGSAYADLDNDGDLDLVTNNIDEEAGVYRNDADKSKMNFLKVKLTGSNENTNGVGALVRVYAKGTMMTRTLSPQRGFQSSVEPLLYFGLGNATAIDSVVVIWPTGEQQARKNITVNQLLVLHQRDAVVKKATHVTQKEFFRQSQRRDMPRHHENDFIDFKVQSLLPRMYSKEGPAFAMADVNGDGKQDMFLGGAKGQVASLLLQQRDGSFTQRSSTIFDAGRNSEDVDATFFDMDHDGDQDLYVVTGGYEFDTTDVALQDHLYRNDGRGNFTAAPLPSMLSSGSCVRHADVDNDGDEDLFVGGRIVPGHYPKAPRSYLLINDGKGSFSDETLKWAPVIMRSGMITDALWLDLNGDKNLDLITVGEWMPIALYINRDSKLQDKTSEFIQDDTRGWWSCLASGDLDGDGDADLIAGNYGMNNQFKATAQRPVTLYYGDYDKNGSTDPLMNYYIGDKSYPSATRDELTDQLPSFKKKFPDYASYATATIEDVLSPDELKQSRELKATMFESVCMLRDGNGFTIKPLPVQAQYAPLVSVLLFDIDKDGKEDLVTGGNLSGGRARFGKASANYGFAFLNTGHGNFAFVDPRTSGICIRGDVKKILVDGETIFFATNNNVVAEADVAKK